MGLVGLFNHLRAVGLAIAALQLGGCMGALSNDEPRTLTIEPSRYSVAFDAAAKATRAMGYEIEVVDRSNGIIESKPRHAGGALEPWRIDNSGPTDAAANTLSHRRRKIRIEFTPVGLVLDAGEPDPVLRGPAIPGSTLVQQRFDLQTTKSPIEMRTWVYIERSFRPGAKPSTYSGALATSWSDPLAAKPADAGDESIRERAQWTPVGRDRAYEATLTDRVAEALGSSPDQPVPPSIAPPPIQ